MMARAALWRSLVLLALLAGLPAPLTAQDAGADPAPAATTPAPDGAAPVAPQTGTITGVVPAAPSAVTTAPGLTKTQTAGTRSGTKSISLTPSDQQTVDYAAWEAIATRAERATAETQTSTNGLELLRGQLVDWRGKLQAAQNTNASRITSLREQIAALGAAPADGATEAPEIAERRKTLTEQLTKVEAPRRAAEEAYRRANGLIAEIDREIRERQTEQLLKLWPSPANPANWPDAALAVRDSLVGLWNEVRNNWARETRRAEMVDTLPVSALLLIVSLVLIFRGRHWIERFANWVNQSASALRWSRVLSFVASLGQVIVPTAGTLLVSVALTLTQMPGFVGQAVLAALPAAGLTLFFSYWLAGRIFPRSNCAAGPLGLQPEHCAEGRFHTTMIGLVQGLELIRMALLPAANVPEAAVSVLGLPFLLVMSLLLWRVGHLLNRHVAAGDEEEGPSFRDRVIQIIGKVLIALAVVGPSLAVIGYTTAAQALIFPAASSLGLAGLLLVLVQLISDIYRAIIRAETEEQGQGLLPVLAGFLLTLASLPLFALIWGARVEDLGELWNRFTEGFLIGETRISPSNFLYFLILFGIGFTVTRMFQGVLRSSILPKTKLDQGGRNAIVSGTGYIGIFIAGVIAFSSAGIDLSGLAIVASALSLGIGFGLQNIVSNFVSGVILLIERPVSEGDWIEVGTVSGTVRNISVRSTRIQTFDRSDVIVPNADLVTQRVTNWTRFNLNGRLIVPLMVVHGSDPDRVMQILQEIAEAQPLVVLNPPPVVALTGFTMDGQQYELRMILRDVNFQLSVKTAVNLEILRRFRAEGIFLAHAGADAKPFPLVEATAEPAADPVVPASEPRPGLFDGPEDETER